MRMFSRRFAPGRFLRLIKEGRKAWRRIGRLVGWLEGLVFLVFAPVFCLAGWARLTFGRIDYDQIALHCGVGNLPYVPRIYLVCFGAYCVAGLAAGLLYGRLVVAGLPSRLRRRLALTGGQVFWFKALNLVGLAALVELTLWLVFCEFRFPLCGSDVREFSRCFEEQYVPVIQADLRFPERKRNLIYIVCESLENTFSCPEFFDEDLMPEMTCLAAENDSFPGCRTVRGTDCTVKSLHAGQYGFPCPSMREFGRSLGSGIYPDSVYRCLSLFQVLGRNGYQTEYILGGKLEFAKTDLIYRNVPGIRLRSWNDLRTDPEYLGLSHRSKWGVNDRILWKHVRREVTALARCGRPFALQISTIDTHFPSEYIGDGERRKFDDYRDAVVLQSRMVQEFIDWLRGQDFYPDTEIAITGDHLSWVDFPRKLGRERPGFQRTVYNCFLNSSVRPRKGPGPGRRRVWAVFDMLPTILEAMGVTWQGHRLGVGTSLYSGERTWLEKIGLDAYEREMAKTSRHYEHLH